MAIAPPSTSISEPLMEDDSSEARNRMAYATSSTSPGRRIGMTRMRSARTAGSAVRPDVRIGGMMPGWTELARILSLACCTATDLVISRTAAFEALEAMWTCSLPMMPAIDERLTIDPPPLAIMGGTAYLMPKNTPVALTAMIRCQASVL